MPPKSDFIVMAVSVEGLLCSAMKFMWARVKTGEQSKYKYWRADDQCENIYKVTVRPCSKMVSIVLYASSNINLLSNKYLEERRNLSKLRDSSKLHPQVEPVVIYP